MRIERLDLGLQHVDPVAIDYRPEADDVHADPFGLPDQCVWNELAEEPQASSSRPFGTWALMLVRVTMDDLLACSPQAAVGLGLRVSGAQDGRTGSEPVRVTETERGMHAYESPEDSGQAVRSRQGLDHHGRGSFASECGWEVPTFCHVGIQWSWAQ
jgi:hypothetical protein